MAEMFSNAAAYERYMGRWSAKLARLFAGAAFLAVAILMLFALVAFWLIRPRELAGDRGM